MSGGGDTTTTTANTTPWATQQPYLAGGFAGAQNLLNNSIPQFYPGSTVAPQSTYRQPALNAAWNLGAEGTPEMAAISNMGQGLLGNGSQGLAGTRTMQQTANGRFVGQQNPYFQDMVTQSIQAARPGIDSAFAANGRLGSGAYANAFADAAMRAASNLGYQNYAAERGYQNQAAGQLANLDLSARNLGGNLTQAANADTYQRTGLLGNVADYADAYNQKLTDADVQRYNFGQQAPWDYLQRYMGLVGGKDWGGTQAQTASTNLSSGTQAAQWGAILAQLMKGL